MNIMWNWRNTKFLSDFYNNLSGVRCISNKSVVVAKMKRKMYLRTYPTMVVEPDGSTYTIRHHEPRAIIKLPLDLTKVSEELRLQILESRKPKKKVVIEEELEDNFDSAEYIQILQRGKAAGK